MHNPRRKREQRSAFTLLEVILALAILAGAVAILGEVMSIAGRSASDAQAESKAQMLASSVMDEMLAGLVPMTQQSRSPLDSDSAIPWVYSVTLTDTAFVGLSAVEVVVEQDLEKQFRPVKYRLVRWVSEDSLIDDSEEDSTEEDSDA